MVQLFHKIGSTENRRQLLLWTRRKIAQNIIPNYYFHTQVPQISGISYKRMHHIVQFQQFENLKETAANGLIKFEQQKR